MKELERYKLLVIRYINIRDLMYNMMNIFNIVVPYVRKLRQQILRVLITRKIYILSNLFNFVST